MKMLMWLIDKILQALDARAKVKVLVHEAYFEDDPVLKLFYFVKVINFSADAPFTITHIYVKDGAKEVEILNPSRVLPHKLERTDVWETWFPKDAIQNKNNVFKNVRVVLSSGKIYKSKENLKVRPTGFIA